MWTLKGETMPKQMQRVYDAMKDKRWRTLWQIEALTGDPQASISARLRDLKKLGYSIKKRKRDNPYLGVFEYRMERQNATPRNS